jgi:hypothetical protein
MNSRDLASSDNLFDFFHGHVGAAVRETDAPVSEEGVFYLSNLLVERARTPPRVERVETLAELHIHAASGSRVEAIRSYRELGDKALVTAGFFRDSLNRGAVGIDYYVQMGSAAYERLSNLLEGPRDLLVGAARGLDAIFAELSLSFSSCADLLREVRDGILAEGSADRDVDVLRLYEEWLATGSPRVAARLGELGLLPMRAQGPGRAC